MHIHYMEGCQ